MNAGPPVLMLHTAAERPDPWERMRIYERLGARVSTPLPRSLRMTGSVEEWESWTGMAFPDSGDYVFPEGLVPLHVDRESGQERTGNRTSG